MSSKYLYTCDLCKMEAENYRPNFVTVQDFDGTIVGHLCNHCLEWIKHLMNRKPIETEL